MIEDAEVIEILINEYNNFCKKYDASNFQLLDYNFNQDFNNLRIEISINNITNLYTIYVWSPGFMDENDEYPDNLIFKTDCNPEGESFTNIKNVFEFLLYDFRDKYNYSKIIDRFELNTNIEYEEKKRFSFTRLCYNKKIDTCCVCYDTNIVITNCSHNLCRICYENISIIIDNDDMYEMGYKECPLCRNKI
jgi:hypothetical protein